MKRHISKTIAAAMVATIVISISMLTACEGRKMTNMVPTGETVEVNVGQSEYDSSYDSTEGFNQTDTTHPKDTTANI